MQIDIDFRSGAPIYIQIMDQIRQKIASGELKVGDQLPTVRQLATDLRINWNTVARAYRMLDEAGLISTQHGRGTYVWEMPTEEVTGRLREQALEGLTRRYLADSARLGCSPSQVIQVLKKHVDAWQAGDQPQEVN